MYYEHISKTGTIISHKNGFGNNESAITSSHVHDTFEIVYMLKGDVDFTVEHKTRHLEPGDFVVIAPGKYHHVKANPDVDFDHFLFAFHENKIFKELCDTLYEKDPFYTNCQHIGLLTMYFDECYEKFDGVVLDTLFKGELLKIIAMLCYTANHTPEVGTALVSQAINYIDRHLQENIYLEDIAKHCNVTKLVLSDEFKAKVGITIMHYVAAKKALATKQAIMNGMKKGEAATKFGYSNYSTFYRGYQKLKVLDLEELIKKTM